MNIVYALFAPWRGCALRRFAVDIYPHLPVPSRPLMRLWRLPAWRSVVACQVWQDRLL
jgi:hypothetical protein